MNEMIKEGAMFELHLYFCFPSSRLYTKKNELKKLDTTNRIKSIEDAISKLLGVDDKYFNPTRAERVICKLLEGEGHVHCQIFKSQKLRQEKEILDFLTFQQK